jgi:hypothetical protein
MNSVNLTNISATKIAVQKYDELLQQISLLKRENHELKEVIRDNEIKAGLLIDHYQSEIDTQTLVANGLKDELRAREGMEVRNQNRDFREVSTWIEEHELLSKENELFAIINALENEIQTLKGDKIEQTIEFERKTRENRENAMQSVMLDVNLRSRNSDTEYEEVRRAIEETVSDNHRLKSEFRLLLRELEKLQVSMDQKNVELARTKRELELKTALP